MIRWVGRQETLVSDPSSARYWSVSSTKQLRWRTESCMRLYRDNLPVPTVCKQNRNFASVDSLKFVWRSFPDIIRDSTFYDTVVDFELIWCYDITVSDSIRQSDRIGRVVSVYARLKMLDCRQMTGNAKTRFSLCYWHALNTGD